jgi:hypothetical protein
VAFVQRFGGALNVNVHAHALLPDGVFVLDQSGAYRFVRLPPPEDHDILRLTERLARRVTAYLERRFGALEPAPGDMLEAAIGEGMQVVPLLAGEVEALENDESSKVRTARRAASVDGFSIHAATAVPAKNRVGLEKLCRYGMRPAFSHERLSLAEDGRVLVALRRPWPTVNGVSVLAFEPVAFLRRLAPLIPPPCAHLVRHYGLFAPNAKGRDLLPAAPVSRPSAVRLAAERRAVVSQPPAREDYPPKQDREPRSRRRVLPWAELLRRVFAVDVLVCAKCLGAMSVIAYLTDAVVVAKILAHLGLPSSPPPISPARISAQMEMFDDERLGRRPSRGARGPPSRHGHAASDIDDSTDATDWGA